MGNIRIVESRVIVHQPQCEAVVLRVQIALPCVAEIGLRDRAYISARLAEGQVTLLAKQGAAGIRDSHHRTKLVGQEYRQTAEEPTRFAANRLPSQPTSLARTIAQPGLPFGRECFSAAQPASNHLRTTGAGFALR